MKSEKMKGSINLEIVTQNNGSLLH
jgi:hypothetical protein